ncbi:DUF3303 domain-containing protein [Arenibacterium sp. LLYu02]|uniref:DUF3303 domain-containing protein n=1 Tax=Arenibacterium sp. LLYu02 TaxID=3404132 RepID=UPI003B21A795
MKRFMVIERFKDGNGETVYDRFHREGRLLPQGLLYLNSWVSREKGICYQLMETNRPELFDQWFARWSDLVDFELVPID